MEVEMMRIMSGRNVLVVLTWLALALTACAQQPVQQDQVVEVPQDNVSSMGRPDKTDIVLVTSDQYYLVEKQQEVASQLDELINAGSYDITEVQTYYSDGYLTAARVTYVPEVEGDGNKLRVKFIQSDKYYVNEKDQDVKKGLEEALASTDVLKVNTIFQNGYLLAAEVWYLEK